MNWAAMPSSVAQIGRTAPRSTKKRDNYTRSMSIETPTLRRHAPDWIVLTIACLAQFMVVLDVSIVNVALPSMQRDLHFSLSSAQWVVNAYVLTFAGFLLLGGRAADIFGRRRVYLTGLFIFTLASVGAGFAAIAMMVSANTSIQLAVPDRLRGRVLSVYTTVFAGSTPIGAPIIGWLASAFSTQVALVVGGGIALVAAIVAGAWVARGGLSSAGSLGDAGRRHQGAIGRGEGAP